MLAKKCSMILLGVLLLVGFAQRARAQTVDLTFPLTHSTQVQWEITTDALSRIPTHDRETLKQIMVKRNPDLARSKVDAFALDIGIQDITAKGKDQKLDPHQVEVVAAQTGRVIQVINLNEPGKEAGWQVKLEHEGYTTTYTHIVPKDAIKGWRPGETLKVGPGEFIGNIASKEDVLGPGKRTQSEWWTGPHLHFQVNIEDNTKTRISLAGREVGEYRENKWYASKDYEEGAVAGIFRQLLGRDPTGDEKKEALAKLRDGETVAEIRRDVSESPRYAKERAEYIEGLRADMKRWQDEARKPFAKRLLEESIKEVEKRVESVKATMGRFLGVQNAQAAAPKPFYDLPQRTAQQQLTPMAASFSETYSGTMSQTVSVIGLPTSPFIGSFSGTRTGAVPGDFTGTFTGTNVYTCSGCWANPNYKNIPFTATMTGEVKGFQGQDLKGTANVTITDGLVPTGNRFTLSGNVTLKRDGSLTAPSLTGQNYQYRGIAGVTPGIVGTSTISHTQTPR